MHLTYSVTPLSGQQSTIKTLSWTTASASYVGLTPLGLRQLAGIIELV